MYMARKKQRSPDQYEALAAAAAHLCSEGKKQKDVATLLGVSQPEVCRLLRHAETREYFDPTPRFVPSEESMHLWEQAQRELLACPDLGDKLKGWAPKDVRCEARIVYSDRHSEFGRGAAIHINDLVVQDHDVRSVGVLWGKTLAQVIRGLTSEPKPPRHDNRIHFAPIDRKSTRLNSSHLGISYAVFC